MIFCGFGDQKVARDIVNWDTVSRMARKLLSPTVSGEPRTFINEDLNMAGTMTLTAFAYLTYISRRV